MELHWRSFELRPSGSPPMPPEYRARIEAARPAMEKMARDQYGLELNPGPFGINSRAALVGAKFAEAHELGLPYHDAVFKAYWRNGQDIGDTAVLVELAGKVGLDAAAFRTALDDPQYARQVDADINQAHQYGLSGVPAAVFAGKYLVSGAQPYPLFVEVTDKVLAEQ